MVHQSKDGFLIFLHKKLSLSQATVVTSQMVSTLLSKLQSVNSEPIATIEYVDGDGGAHPSSLADTEVIDGQDSEDIRALRIAAIQAEIPFVDYVETMRTKDHIQQMLKTRETKEARLKYLGICFFGELESLKNLLKA